MTHDGLPEGYKPTNTVEVVAGAGRKYEQISSNVFTPDHLAHDELLARLSIEQGCPVGDALLAVVELHHPCWGDEHDDDGCDA